MDEVFSVFLTPATVFICLTTYVLTYVVRTVTEALWPSVVKARLWNELFLPLGAIGNGALLGLMAKTFMWPDLVSKTVAGRMMYGAICGMFCGFLYSRVRSWLSSKGTEVDVKYLPPAPKSVAAAPGGSNEEEVQEAPLGGKSEEPKP